MKTATVRLGGAIDIGRAAIDDVELEFDEGVARRQLAQGDHALTWFVQAHPGTKYLIEITEPEEATFRHQDTIDSTTRDAGVQWFQIGGGK